MVTATQVTLLNASYEPHDVVPFKHAVKMLFRGVATVEEAHVLPDGSPRMIGPHPWPRVIRLIRYVAQKWLYDQNGRATYSRTGLLRRDRHKCAYCGGRARTVDHVLPRCQGGKTTWLNTVAACRSCNGRKDGRTPEQAGMPLLFEPFVPTPAQVRHGR